MNVVRKTGIALAAAVLAMITIGAPTAAHGNEDTGWGGGTFTHPTVVD